MVKLLIQIPCFNEEESLEQTINAFPKIIDGIDTIEWLIIDDGSQDKTLQVARSLGVHHIITHNQNRGLAQAFMTGLDACVKLGADIIINTDADNQYNANDMPALVKPILEGKADIVVGIRPIDQIEGFSWYKKLLQKLGSWVVRKASQTEIKDAPSGFRAFSKKAAMKVNVFSEYTYTLETIIQAGRKGIAIISVPVRVNQDLRPSRLVRSIPSYIFRSAETIVRIGMTYRPFRFFANPGIIFLLAGLAIGLRFIIFYLRGAGSGHIQSLILCAILIGCGVALLLIGLIADLIAVNRKLLEEILFRVRTIESENEKEKENEN